MVSKRNLLAASTSCLGRECTGGNWVFTRTGTAADSGCVIPYVTSSSRFLYNIDYKNGILILTSTGTKSRANGQGTALIQLLAVHKHTKEQRRVLLRIGDGKGTYIKACQQDLMGTSFLSRHGVIMVSDHLRPHAQIRDTDFEVECVESRGLTYIPMSIYNKGCNNPSCKSCARMMGESAWGDQTYRHTLQPKITASVAASDAKVRFWHLVACDDESTYELATQHSADEFKAALKARQRADRSKLRPLWNIDGEFSHAGMRLEALDESLAGFTAKFLGGDTEKFQNSNFSAQNPAFSITATPAWLETPTTVFLNAPPKVPQSPHEQAVRDILNQGRFGADDLNVGFDINGSLEGLQQAAERKMKQQDDGIRHQPSRVTKAREIKNIASPMLWHHRTGCGGMRSLKATAACVTGMNFSSGDWQNCNCPACFANKPKQTMQRSAPRKRDEDSILEPFKRAVADLKGPLKQSRAGFCWFLAITCRDSSLIFPGFAMRKSDAPRLMKEFLEWGKALNVAVETFSSDADSVFISKTFRKLLEEWSITQRVYLRSHHGSAAERAILHSIRRANAILIHAIMGAKMWVDAVRFSVQIWNRLVNVDHPNAQMRQKTRLELLTGKKTDWSGWRVPLCDAYPVVHNLRFGHFQSKLLPGRWINLGLDELVFAYRLLDLMSNKEILHYHVWFEESMSGRKDALTQFDEKYLRGLQRLKNGETKIAMSRYERQAVQLRQLYRNETTHPHDVITIDGVELNEFISPNKNGTLEPETLVEATIDDFGISTDMSHLDPEKMNHGKPSDDKVAEQPNDVSETHQELDDEDEGSYFQKPKDPDSQVDHNELEFQSEDENIDCAADDEEYSELIRLKDLKDHQALADKEIRNEASKNKEDDVILDTADIEADEGMIINDYLATKSEDAPTSAIDDSYEDLQRQVRRRNREKGVPSNDELRNLQPKLESYRAKAFAPVIGKLKNEVKDALQYAWQRNINITWLVTANPKRANSKIKFQAYWNDGKNSLSEAKDNGMSWADFVNDFQRGFFTIDPADTDDNAELGAKINSILTEAKGDSTQSGSLIGSVLNAPTHFSRGDRVSLSLMEDSRYRSRNLNGLTGTLEGWCNPIGRYKVRLDVPTEEHEHLFVRTFHLRIIPAPVHHTNKVKFGPKTEEETISDDEAVLSVLKDRIRLLSLDLAEPESMTTLQLYELMGEGYKVAIAKAFDVYTPKSFKDAVTCDDQSDWIKSIIKEIVSLEKAGTWTVVHRDRAKSEGKRVMKSGFVFRTKCDQNGFVKSFENGGQKSRFVAKGYSERYQQDYWNVRSGVVDYVSARFLIAIAAAERSKMYTYDVKNAFVSTDVPEGEEFYCEAPEDDVNNTIFGDRFTMADGTRGVLRCHKCLYGSKNSPRRFWQKLEKVLSTGGFKPCIQDQCVLVCDRRPYGGGILRVACWVDDILLTVKNQADKEWFDHLMADNFEMSPDSGEEEAKLYLGMKVSRDAKKHTITLSSPALVESMINDLVEGGHLHPDAGTKDHPMSGQRLEPAGPDEIGKPETEYPYRMVVGVALHLSRTTRPDISYAVSELSRHVTKATTAHIGAANWLACYLKGTTTLGITYHGEIKSSLQNKLISFADADWAGDASTRKSRSGYTLQFNLGPVEWFSKGQTIQSTSSCMSETIAAVEAAKAIVSARLLLYELGYPQPGSSRLYVDNEATVLNANGDKQSKRSKHFQIRTELLRAYTQLGRLHVHSIDTLRNISDLHTKSLIGKKFQELRDLMMGVEIFDDIMDLC